MKKRLYSAMLVTSLVLVILAAHDVLIYRTLRYRAVSELNACMAQTIADLKKEVPSRGEAYFQNYWGAIVMDCHHSLEFHYMYPRNQGILVYPE